ncbi:hypothetical protein [Sinorhizobium meliloti]|uniref:hypothetical protein n=1 Tax=Rhizobium meliloti TaxID=382 RepID=UPI001F24D3AB|nr:hypothetical protein [Sinorhizobium meliloti]
MCSSAYIEQNQIAEIKSRVLTFNRDNSVRERLVYDAGVADDEPTTFAVRQGSPDGNIL